MNLLAYQREKTILFLEKESASGRVSSVIHTNHPSFPDRLRILWKPINSTPTCSWVNKATQSGHIHTRYAGQKDLGTLKVGAWAYHTSRESKLLWGLPLLPGHRNMSSTRLVYCCYL